MGCMMTITDIEEWRDYIETQKSDIIEFVMAGGCSVINHEQ